MKYSILSTLCGLLIFFAHISIAAIVPEEARPGSIKDGTGTAEDQQAIPITIIPSRGQLLYENHCLTCHESQVHIRQKAKAKDFTRIASFVAIWSRELNVGWSNDEILSVTTYLNQRYYKYQTK